MSWILPLISSVVLAQGTGVVAVPTEFDRYCSTLDSGIAMAARLEAGGWHHFEADKASEVGRLVAAINKVPSADFRIATQVFRASATGPVVLVSQMTAPDATGSIECKFIDESAPLPKTSTLQNWAGRKPVVAKKDGAITWVWKPGRGDAQMTAVVYVDPASKPRFPGVGVITTSLRFY